MKIRIAMQTLGLLVVFFICFFSSPLYSAGVPVNTNPILWTNQDYGSVNPLNFTVAYVQSSDISPSRKTEIGEIVKHWAVGMFEMTNAKHQLGTIKIMARRYFVWATFSRRPSSADRTLVYRRRDRTRL
jgi:hypothetical protein